MHDDVLYAVFAQRHGYISSEEFTNIFYSYVVDPSKDILSRLKLKLGKKKFDALKTLVANSMDQKTRMAMENKESERDTQRNHDVGGLSTIQMSFDVSTSNLGGEGRYHTQGVIAISQEPEGRYTIYQEMARGGIGRILIANDEHMGREVAIKELLPQNFGNMGRPLSLEEEEMLSHQIEMVNQRFLREATVTGRLEHPSIVPVYEIGQRKDDTLYYTMRLVKGRTLADAIYEAKTLKERLNLLPHFRDLCNAISYAHSKGVIHRDIKPENIMIGEFGETVVLDWGLAKVKGEEDQINPYTGNRGGMANKTLDGKALGTPSYMPPEQARGDIRAIDEISDIYSLGAVLYEILTGAPPFEGETAWDTINQVLGFNVVPVTEIEEKAPIELAAIAEKALSKEKKERYPSSVALVGEIERYMAGERITSYNYSNWELLKRFVRSHKVILSALGFILLALIATLIFVSYSYQKELVARDRMKVAIEQEIEERNTANYHIAQTLNERAYRLERDKKFLESRIFAALALKHNPGNPQSPLYSTRFARSKPKIGELTLGAKSKIYRSQVSYRLRLERNIHVPSRILSLAVDKKGSYAALGCQDNTARIVDLKTGKTLRTVAGHLGPINAVDISSSGRFLATGSQDRAVKIWDLKSGKNIATMLEHLDEVASVHFSPGDALLVSASLDKSAIVWRVESGMNIRKIKPARSIAYIPDPTKSKVFNANRAANWYRKFGLIYSRGRVYTKRWKPIRDLYSRGHRNFIYAAKFDPDGQFLVTAGWDRVAKLWDLKTGKLLHNLLGHTDRLFDVQYSPRGDTIATSSWDRTVKLWSAKTGQLQTTLKGHRGRVLGIHFSPDGKVLASVGEHGFLLIWDVVSSALLLSVKAHQDTITGVAFSQDGQHIYTAGRDNQLRVWTVVPSDREKLFRGHSQPVNSVALSPDGKLLASGSWDKTVKIWSIETQRLLHNLRSSKKVESAHDNRVWGVAFSPDGSLLASGSMDKTVKIWSVATGKLLHTLEGHRGGIYRIAWAPNGQVVASASLDKTVKLWDPKSGTLLHSLEHHTERVRGISFSPDSKVIASVGNDRTVRISDVAAGPEINTLRAHQDWVTGVTFTPDGTSILSCGKRGNIIKWKYPLGIKEREFVAHQGRINAVVATRDGRYFATASDDRTVRFWSLTSLEPLLIIYTEYEIFAMDLSGDGKLLAIGDGRNLKAIPITLNWKTRNPTVLIKRYTKSAGVKLNGFSLELVGSRKKRVGSKKSARR